METNLTNYKNYVISTEKGIEKGVFFRSPIQSVYFDAYYDESLFSAFDYQNKIRNPIRRLYEFLIGNGVIVKNIDDWAKESNWCGFTANKLCFPIYFKRRYRKLVARSIEDDPIQEIYSYGYEGEFENVSGYCDKERTIVFLKKW